MRMYIRLTLYNYSALAAIFRVDVWVLAALYSVIT